MANRTVTLVRNCKTEKGWRRYPFTSVRLLLCLVFQLSPEIEPLPDDCVRFDVAARILPLSHAERESHRRSDH